MKRNCECIFGTVAVIHMSPDPARSLSKTNGTVFVTGFGKITIAAAFAVTAGIPMTRIFVLR
jgi:hypothetical protein